MFACVSVSIKISLINSLKRKQITDVKRIEQSRRLLINKFFVGNYLHDKFDINFHNVTKVTNNHTAVSVTLKKRSHN